MLFIAFLSMTTTSLIAQKNWTYMVYLFGSDLEGGFEKNGGQYGNAATRDIGEMMKVSSTNNVNIIVTTGGSDKEGWKEIKRWKIENGQQIPIEFNAPNNRMGDHKNLTAFIDWATATYPADKYVLDLWNHGGDIQGYGGDEIPGNNHEVMSVPHIKQAIQSSSFISQGKKFEILGFDACLMANLEVHNAVKTFSNYIVSSEQTEPGHGWNYVPIMTAMENGSANDGLSLGKVIADGFKAHASNLQTNQVTLSVVESSQIDNVVSAVEGMFNAVGTSGIADLQKARARSEDYASTDTGQDAINNHDVVDIGNLAQNLKGTNSAYGNAADQVINAVNSAVKYTIKDSKQPYSTGLSLFIPHKLFGAENAVQGVIQRYYDPLNFSPNIKNYIKQYAEMAKGNAENGAPDGDTADPEGDYDDWEGGNLRSPVKAGSRNNESNQNQVARAIVNDPGDLETVRVLLIETNALEDENDFLTLGAVLPDALRYSADGRLLIEYEWDQEWLGIGGHPVNIQNIKQTTNADTRMAPGGLPNMEDAVEGPCGNNCLGVPDRTRGPGTMTTITIPAVLNPDEGFFGRDVYLNYIQTEDEGYELISIIPQREEGEPNQGQKIRLNLVPGDRVMLLYDGFNEVKNDLFDAVDPDAVFTIENGNEDLALEPILLPLGSEYRVAFELIDFSQQNTIIYDPRNFVTSEIMVGDVATTTGATTMDVCTKDGISDIITFELADCNTDNITYVLTTDQDIILGAISPKIEFEGAPVYNFRVYGLAYSGNLTVNYGDNILSDNLAEGDFTLTDNFVAVNVLEAGACSNLQGNLDQDSRAYFDASENYLQPTLELATDLEDKPMVLADLLKHRKIVLAPNTTRAYPNPVSTFVNLDLGQYEGKQGHISIINTLGQATKQLEISEIAKHPISIDVQSFKTGIYLIQINVDGALIDTHKFIKNGTER